MTRGRSGTDALLVDAVFSGQRTSNTSLRLLAWACAIGAHVSLFFLAQLSGPSLETWSARVATMVHHDLNAHAPTSVETIEPPKPPPPAPSLPPPAAVPVPAARARAPQPTAAPAQAAKIITAEPQDTNAPVDLTDNAFITGTASAYAGGATTSHGTSQRAVSRAALESEQSARAQPPSASAAQPVSLTSEQWHCPWPAAALAQDLYEQAVIVRARVRSDGSVESANVVADPGNGFGAAAIDCTLHTRFNPARNASGEAVPALSPPIRVRFTR